MESTGISGAEEDQLRGLRVEETKALLSWFISQYPEGAALSCSLQPESIVLISLIRSLGLAVRVFFIDTGRHFPETLRFLSEVEAFFGVSIESWAPLPQEVRSMTEEHGEDLFYDGVMQRKLCCHVRKVRVTERALRGTQLWIAGLRRAQSPERSRVETVVWSPSLQLVKLHPLAGWSDDDLSRYVNDHELPEHPLIAQGFASIGCAPCTRSVAPNEDPRAGRWWWEGGGKKECGLHRDVGHYVI